MKLFRWQFGRQGSGYKVFPLFFSKLLGADAYLIQIPEGVSVPCHTDPVTNKKHYRANVHFGFFEGGRFFSADYIVKLFSTLYVFRPDICAHWMDKVTKGRVFIFSVGWTLNKRDY